MPPKIKKGSSDAREDRSDEVYVLIRVPRIVRDRFAAACRLDNGATMLSTIASLMQRYIQEVDHRLKR